MEITMAGQITWPDHVTIETPELLHLWQQNQAQNQNNIGIY